MRVEIDCAEIKAPGIYVSRASLPNRFKPNDPYGPEWNGDEVWEGHSLGVFRGLIFGLAFQSFVFLGIYLVYRVL